MGCEDYSIKNDYFDSHNYIDASHLNYHKPIATLNYKQTR